eukprot:TRINITY_DN22194_c0_g1_i1.p1 TRINITY_DN22194_c0_g1~~TRINITY_DN22194_c0_g1_i1.p1  ORF type:complete len:534 (+),score=96.65 TRINITY_DN22194_c0_g1_i1:185-1786(+)
MACALPGHHDRVLTLCINILILSALGVFSPALAERPSKGARLHKLQPSASVDSEKASEKGGLVANHSSAAAAVQPGSEAPASRSDGGASSRGGGVHNETDRMRSLLSWAAQHHIRGVANLEVNTIPPMHHASGHAARSRPTAALVLKRAVQPGATVLSVPSELLLWSHGVETEAKFRKAGVPESVLAEGAPRLSNSSSEGRLRLAAGVLALQGGRTSEDWATYFRTWPSFDEFKRVHPSAARPALFAKFRQLPVSTKLRAQQQRRKSRWQEFRRRGGRCTSQAWHWAELAVMTRSWGGPGGHGSLLAPVVDAIRPAPPGRSNVLATYGNPDLGSSFVLTASRHLAAGEELLLDYGRMPDDMFMPIWGYTPGHFAPTRLDDVTCARFANLTGLWNAEANQSVAGASNASTSAAATEGSSWRLLGRLHKSTPATGPPLCKPPQGEPQEEAYCALASLAAEQCGKGGPLPQVSVGGIPFYRHPVVVALFILGLSTIVARFVFHTTGNTRTLFSTRRFSGSDEKELLTVRAARRRLN